MFRSGIDPGVYLSRTVCLEKQNIVGLELVSQFHAGAAQRHSGNGEPKRIFRFLVQKALDQIGRDMTLEHEPLSRNCGVTGLVLWGYAALQFFSVEIRWMTDLSHESAFGDMIDPQGAAAAAWILEHFECDWRGGWRCCGIHCISFTGGKPEAEGDQQQGSLQGRCDSLNGLVIGVLIVHIASHGVCQFV